MFHLLVQNLLFMALVSGFLWSGYGISRLAVSDSIKNLLTMGLMFVFFAIFGVFYFAEGANAAKIADFGGVKLKDYFKNLVPSIKDGMLYGLMIALLVSIAIVSLPFYIHMFAPGDGQKGNILGLVFASFIFWFEVVTFLSLQWFLPVRSLMHNKFLKCLKKSYILFFDNAGFTVLLALVNLLNLIITVLTLGMIPGIHGMTITCSDALRLRMYKYDWYEVNPGMTKQQRKEVPWDDLLANDKRALGPRKWKSFLFPWKE